MEIQQNCNVKIQTKLYPSLMIPSAGLQSYCRLYWFH